MSDVNSQTEEKESINSQIQQDQIVIEELNEQADALRTVTQEFKSQAMLIADEKELFFQRKDAVVSKLKMLQSKKQYLKFTLIDNQQLLNQKQNNNNTPQPLQTTSGSDNQTLQKENLLQLQRKRKEEQYRKKQELQEKLEKQKQEQRLYQQELQDRLNQEQFRKLEMEQAEQQRKEAMEQEMRAIKMQKELYESQRMKKLQSDKKANLSKMYNEMYSQRLRLEKEEQEARLRQQQENQQRNKQRELEKLSAEQAQVKIASLMKMKIAKNQTDQIQDLKEKEQQEDLQRQRYESEQEMQQKYQMEKQQQMRKEQELTRQRYEYEQEMQQKYQMEKQQQMRKEQEEYELMSRRQLQEKQIKIDNFASSKSYGIKKNLDLAQIARFQDFSGCWKFSDSLIQFLGIDPSRFDSELPSEITNLDVWMTLIMVRYLEVYLNSQKSSWKLISSKAVIWLQANQITDINNFNNQIDSLF